LCGQSCQAVEFVFTQFLSTTSAANGSCFTRIINTVCTSFTEIGSTIAKNIAYSTPAGGESLPLVSCENSPKMPESSEATVSCLASCTPGLQMAAPHHSLRT
jgi:hypothetical protein